VQSYGKLTARCALLKTVEVTDDLKKSSLSGSGPTEEGDRERRRDWEGGLQQPNGLKCVVQRACIVRHATTGATVKASR
jgi:hypothetical protein